MVKHKGIAAVVVVAGILIVWILITPPVLVPTGAWVGAGLAWPAGDVALIAIAAVALLGLSRWVSDRMLAIGSVVEGDRLSVKSLALQAAAGVLVLVSGLVYLLAVDLFYLPTPWRAILLVLAVPGLFSGVFAVIRHTPRREAFLSLASWTMAVVGMGFCLASILAL